MNRTEVKLGFSKLAHAQTAQAFSYRKDKIIGINLFCYISKSRQNIDFSDYMFRIWRESNEMKKKLTVCVESLFFSRLITDIGFRLVAADFRVLPVCLGESQLWSDHDLAQRQLPMCSQCNSNYRYYVTIVQQLPEGLWKLPPGHFFNFRNQSVFMPHCQHSVAISSSLKTVGFDLNILNYLHCRSKNGPIIFHSWFMSICCSYPFTEPTLFL